MTTTITETIRLNVIHCANCGIAFAITESFEQERRRDHAGFYCPSGHSLSWRDESDEEKARRLQRLAEAETARVREALAFERRSHSATRGLLTRERKRVAAGVCPVCRRNFVALGRHVRGQHPDYAGAEAEA